MTDVPATPPSGAPPPGAPRHEAAGRGRCTVCGRAVVEPRFRPFCSERCKQVDLGRWLGGHYAIPGEALDGGDEDPLA